MTDLENNVNFEKISIFLTFNNNFFEILKFKKKKIFFAFLLGFTSQFEHFFDMLQIVLNFVCHMSENQKKNWRQYFDT